VLQYKAIEYAKQLVIKNGIKEEDINVMADDELEVV